MFSSVTSPSWAANDGSGKECGAPRPPGLVICDPLNLCAEAIGAAVRRHTAWPVEWATTDLELAASTAAERGARAIVFDPRRGTPKAVSQTVGRLRARCPGGALMLLTAHEGAAFMRSALGAGVAVCVHKRDDLAEFKCALEALRLGQQYCSRIVREMLGPCGSVGALEDDCTAAGALRPTRWHADTVSIIETPRREFPADSLERLLHV